MAWTYDVSTPRGQVRLLVGDTDTTDQQLQDAEIDWFLSQNASAPYPSAIGAARALYARYARLVDTTVDDVQERASQARDGYLALVTQLTTQAGTPAVGPYAGGISIADKHTREEDTDRVPPVFTRDMHVVSPSLPSSGDWSNDQ